MLILTNNYLFQKSYDIKKSSYIQFFQMKNSSHLKMAIYSIKN